MTIQPCHKCRLSPDCDLRQSKLKGVRGLSLTAIKFRCQKQRDDLPPGMKVRAKLDYVAVGIDRPYQEPEQVRTEFREVDAVVMKWNGNKVRIFVPYSHEPVNDDRPAWWLQKLSKAPEELSFVHVLRVQPNRLTPTGEQVAVCRHCGMLEGIERPDGWHCRFVSEERGLGYYEEVELECEFTAPPGGPHDPH